MLLYSASDFLVFGFQSHPYTTSEKEWADNSEKKLHVLTLRTMFYADLVDGLVRKTLKIWQFLFTVYQV